MNALVEAVKSLSKRRVSTILLILQFIIGFSTLFGFATVYNSIFQFSNSFKDIADTNKTSFMYNSTRIGSLSRGIQQPDYDDFYKYIQGNNDIKSFGTYTYCNKLLDLNTLNPSEKLQLANKLYSFNGIKINNISGNVENIGANLLVIDQGLNNFIKIPIDQGNNFNLNDFNKNNNEMRDILLGSIFEKYFKVGDIITLQSNKKEQFKISGFIKNNAYFYNNGVGITSSLINLNSILVVPINKEEEADKRMFELRIKNGLLVQLKDNVDFQDASKKINLKAQQLRLSEHNEKLNDILKVITDNFIKDNLSQIIIGMFFCVFSSVGLITSLIVTIYIKKREIGIRIAYGASTFNIFNSLFLEMFFVLIISFIGAIIEYLIEKKGSIILIKRQLAYLSITGIYGSIDVLALIQIFTVVMLILTIISLIVLNLLKKLQPKDLIGGME